MGTYYGISLDVDLDDTALRALRTCSTSWHLDEANQDPDDGLGLVLERRPGGARLHAHATVRNLGTHVAEDLAMCSLVGSVTGTVTVTVTDGGNHLFVARYGPDGVAVGTSECLAAASVPLVSASVHVATLTGVLGAYHLSCLVPHGVRAGEASPSPVHPEDCSCGGWDDAFEVPICHRCTPTALPARFLELPGGAPDLLTAWAAALTEPTAPEVAADMWSFEPLALALLDRRSTDGLEPVSSDDLASALALELPSHELLERVAEHPALTDDLAGNQWLAGTVPDTLAANAALSDEFVHTLPADAVAAAAPWRLGTDVVSRRVADALAPGSPLTAGQLAAILAATAR